ncbi:MAG: DUF4249 family protein [Bacteroidetes bacterium]|nr:DUF4249 family protein [Bacteroidota bacterium]
MKKAFLALSFISIFLSSCKNDLEIIGDQKEVIVIYALLNKSDSISYIKVNKGFASQTEGPIQLAQEPDNLFFDTLNVELKDLTNGSVFHFNKSSMDKDPGTFTQAVNYIYAAPVPLQTGHTYQVNVTNPISGNVAYSSINLIGDPTPKVPVESTIDYYTIVPDKLFTVSFDADPIYAIQYEIRMNFIYDEINTNTSTTVTDTIQWTITTGKFSDGNRVILRLLGSEFYNYLASRLEQKGPEIIRRGKYLQTEYWTADRELSTYMDVYGTSSIGVVQKKSDYTNIKGGFGIFASRNSFKVTSTKLSSSVSDQLKTNPALTPFHFVD